MSKPVKCYLYEAMDRFGWRATWVQTASTDVPAVALPAADFDRLLALLEECAADIEASVRAAYPEGQKVAMPTSRLRRYDRDMDLPRRVRALLKEVGNEIVVSGATDEDPTLSHDTAVRVLALAKRAARMEVVGWWVRIRQRIGGVAWSGWSDWELYGEMPWKDIAQAPRDGRLLVVWLPPHERGDGPPCCLARYYSEACDPEFWDGDEGWLTPEGDYVTPTHFLPLPEPPEAEP